MINPTTRLSRRAMLSGAVATAGGLAAASLTGVPAHAAGARSTTIQHYHQSTAYTCSAASARMALLARGKNVAESTLSSYMHVTPSVGLPDITYLRDAMNHYTGTGYYETKVWGSLATYRAKLEADVHYNVDRGHCVLLNSHYFRSSSSGNMIYTDGHYLVVGGYDDTHGWYLVGDPAFTRLAWWSKADVVGWQKLYRYVA